MAGNYAQRKWLEGRGLLSTPESRSLRAHLDMKAFGGPGALWHGSRCTCDECVAEGFACPCRDPHCFLPEHSRWRKDVQGPAAGKEA